MLGRITITQANTGLPTTPAEAGSAAALISRAYTVIAALADPPGGLPAPTRWEEGR